jgi:hypothetical protein
VERREEETATVNGTPSSEPTAPTPATTVVATATTVVATTATVVTTAKSVTAAKAKTAAPIVAATAKTTTAAASATATGVIMSSTSPAPTTTAATIPPAASQTTEKTAASEAVTRNRVKTAPKIPTTVSEEKRRVNCDSSERDQGQGPTAVGGKEREVDTVTVDTELEETEHEMANIIQSLLERKRNKKQVFQELKEVLGLK